MALAVTWSGYANTDLDISTFFLTDHTVCVRFLAQYPNAYTGPMVSVDGGGTYVLGQGDFREPPATKSKVVLKVGPVEIASAANLPPGTWHHLAAVRHGDQLSLFLDGTTVGQASVLGWDQPSGMMRFGKTASAGLDGGAAQFYGLLDDVAFFSAALSASDVNKLAKTLHLTGNEPHLIAGYTFGYAPKGALPPSLSRPVTMSKGAASVQVSANRNGALDAHNALPLSLVSYMEIPFAPYVPINVIQGFDNPAGSHNGYASFCLDLDLAGKPQSASFNQPFSASAGGTVDWVIQENPSGPDLNYMGVLQAPGETCDYLHLNAHTAQAKSGDHVVAFQHLANMSDVGANKGAFHLHMALGNKPDADRFTGFVTIPLVFSHYEASDDFGNTWYYVLHGVPTAGQWIRRIPAGWNFDIHYTYKWAPPVNDYRLSAAGRYTIGAIPKLSATLRSVRR